ncbi:hypothetical protein HDU92_006403 [Lobulomyces angularis]|nr:hypothetical protein HDU92_006403 [Lobulomyces angularis]
MINLLFNVDLSDFFNVFQNSRHFNLKKVTLTNEITADITIPKLNVAVFCVDPNSFSYDNDEAFNKSAEQLHQRITRSINKKFKVKLLFKLTEVNGDIKKSSLSRNEYHVMLRFQYEIIEKNFTSIDFLPIHKSTQISSIFDDILEVNFLEEIDLDVVNYEHHLPVVLELTSNIHDAYVIQDCFESIYGLSVATKEDLINSSISREISEKILTSFQP